MPEPNYNFSGLQKKAQTATVPAPSDFNFAGLKPKAAPLPDEPKSDPLGFLRSPFNPTGRFIADLAQAKDEPVLPLSKLVPKTEKPLPGGYGVLAGIGRGVTSLAESFTTPQNLAIAVATEGLGLIPIIGKVGLPAVESFFAYEAARQVPDLWRAYQKAPLADKPELMTQIVGSIGITGLAGTGVAKKIGKLGSEAKALTDVSPDVAEPRPPITGELFEPPAQVKRGRQELETAAKTAEAVGETAETARTQTALAESKRRLKEELRTPELQLQALTEEIAGKPVAELSVRQKAEANRKAVVEYRKRLAQNAEVVAFKQGKTLKDIPTEERGPFYAEAGERLRQELVDIQKTAADRKPVEQPQQDVITLAQSLEGVIGPQLAEADLGTPLPKIKPESAGLTIRQALQESWQSKQVQDGDFLREPTAKDVFEQTTGFAFTDNFSKEFQSWRKANGSAFELGDAEIFANQKRAALPKERALTKTEQPKEIKIVDLAPPAERPVDTLAKRRRIAAEKRQSLAEERLKLQEQRLEARRQKAIEQLAKKYRVTGLKNKPNVINRPPAELEAVRPEVTTTLGKSFYELSPEQLDLEINRLQIKDTEDLTRLFGEEGAKRYRALERRANSTSASHAEASQAYSQLEAMAKKLTPEQQNELYNPEHYKNYTLDDLKELRRLFGSLDFDSPGALGESLKYAVTKVGLEFNPAKMTPTEQGYFGQIKYALSEASKRGWNPSEVLTNAVASAAERFDSPANAELMLERYLKTTKSKRPSATPIAPFEQYAQGQKTVESLLAKYKEQAIPKSEWAGLAKEELTKQGYAPRIIAELTEPRRTALEQAPGFETSRAGRAERAIEPPPELKPTVDAIAETAKPNQIAQADYERGRQDILAELQQDPNLKVYFDSGEGFYKVEVLQKQKLTPEALAAVQELRKQAALKGGYSLETVGKGFEIAATPEGFYEGKPLAGKTLAEKVSELVDRKKAADAAQEAFFKAKNGAEKSLVDRYLTEEAPGALAGKTSAGETVEIVTRRNRSAVEPDAPEWLEKIEQAKKTGAKEAGDPYVSIYRVTEKTANKAAGEGFTFLRKNLSEADNARLDAVLDNMTKANGELSANPFFDVRTGLEAYKNLAEIGYLTLKASGKALLTKAEWATRMLADIGESVRPFLDDIWESIQKGWKPGTELEMPKALAERDPKVVAAKETLAKEEPPPTAGDKLNEWARNVKLASTSSLIRSFAGNLTMQMLKTPKRMIAAGANRALAAVTGAKRDRFGQEAATELYGTLKSLKQGVEEAKQVILENPEALKNSLFLSQETGRASGTIEGRKGYYIRMPQKLQGAVDALSRVPSGQGLIDMLAVRQAFKEGLEGDAWVKRVEQLQSETRAGNTEIGKQLLAEAKIEAAEMTFQAELGKIAQKVNAVRDVPGVRFLVPFFNTWVNLWKQGIRHTPLSILRPTFVRSVLKAFEKDPALRSIGSLSDEIAAMTTGTAFTLTTFGALTKLLDGDIIGYGPEDQKERQRLFATGWKPYSLKIGDTYLSFKGFEPLSTWLTMMADANEGRKKEGALGAFDGVSANVIRNFIENPFLTGITETMDALRGGAKPEEFLAGMALGATIPTFLQQTARVIDPKYRQTPKDADALEKFAAEYTKRVPFLSTTLPSELDVFGKEKTVDSPALRYIAVNISKQDRGAIQDELRRLDLGIGFPRDTYKGLELTEPQMRELLVLAGGRMEKALAKMVASPGYKQLRDEEKKSAINYVVNKIRDDSKEFLFKHLAAKKVQPKNRGSAVARPFAK